MLDPIVKEQAENRRGNKGHNDIESQAKARVVALADSNFAKPAGGDLTNTHPVQAEHSQDGARLNADGVGVGCSGLRNSQATLGENQMPCGRNRKVLREPFDDAQENGVPPIH